VASPAPSAPPLPCSERHGVRGSLRGYGVRDGLPDTGGGGKIGEPHKGYIAVPIVCSSSSVIVRLALALLRPQFFFHSGRFFFLISISTLLLPLRLFSSQV